MNDRNEERTPDWTIAMNDGEALVAAAVEGMGLVQAPHYMVTHALRTGAVVEVLERHRPKPQPVSLVYPSHRRVPLRVRALMEAFTPQRVAAVLGLPAATTARTRRKR